MNNQEDSALVRTRAVGDRIAPLLVGLSFACFLFACILFRFREGGIEEKEESKIFGLAWLIIPATTLVLLRVGAKFFGRYATGDLFRSFAILTHAIYWFVFVNALHTHFPDGTIPGKGDPFGIALRPLLVSYVVLNSGLAVTAFFLRNQRAGLRISHFTRNVVDALVPFAICALAVTFSNRTVPPWAPWIVAFCLGATTIALRGKAREERTSWIAHGLFLLVMVLFVYNPSPDVDRESHNFYLGPVAGILAGKSPLVDVNCQYGVGVIYFIAGMIKWHVIVPSMAGFAKLIISLYVIYYALLYWLLLVTTRSFLASAGTIALLVIVCLYAPRDFPTFYPSVGPLRFLWGYLLLAAIALRARYPQWTFVKRLSLVVECASLGIAAIWSLESFVYVFAAYVGWLFFDTVNAANFKAVLARWKRILPVALTIGVAHLVVAIATHLRSGHWPNWGLYLGFIALYTKGGLGQLLITTWTPWVFIAGVYLLSILAFGYRRFVVGTKITDQEDALVFAATALGIAQYTYFLGRSHPNNLYHIAPPAIFVAVSWLAWLSRGERLAGASKAFRISAVYAGVASMFFLALTCVPELLQKYDHYLISFVTAPRNFPAFTPDHRAVEAEALMQKYSRNQRRVVLVSSPDVEVEALLEVGKAELFPISYGLQDAVLPEGVEAAQRFVAPLTANDVVYLDVAGTRLKPGTVESAPPITGDLNPFERTVYDRLRARFAFKVIEETPSGIVAAHPISRT